MCEDLHVFRTHASKTLEGCSWFSRAFSRRGAQFSASKFQANLAGCSIFRTFRARPPKGSFWDFEGLDEDIYSQSLEGLLKQTHMQRLQAVLVGFIGFIGSIGSIGFIGFIYGL